MSENGVRRRQGGDGGSALLCLFTAQGYVSPWCLTPGALRCQPTVLDLHYDLWQLSSQENLEETSLPFWPISAAIECLEEVKQPSPQLLNYDEKHSRSNYFVSGNKMIIFCCTDFIICLSSWSELIFQSSYSLSWHELHLHPFENRVEQAKSGQIIEIKLLLKVIYLSVVWLTFGAWDGIKTEKGNTKTFTNEFYEHNLYANSFLPLHLSTHLSSVWWWCIKIGRRPVVKHVQ